MFPSIFVVSGTAQSTGVSVWFLPSSISWSWLYGLTILVCFLLSLSFHAPRSDGKGNRIPPGPFGLPLLGQSCLYSSTHIRLRIHPGSFPFLTHYPEVTLDYWYKKFGKMYSFRLGNQLVMAISDPRIVKDLMVTNGAIFSSRKDMFVKAQTIFLRRAITGTGYNDTWCV